MQRIRAGRSTCGPDQPMGANGEVPEWPQIVEWMPDAQELIVAGVRQPRP